MAIMLLVNSELKGDISCLIWGTPRSEMISFNVNNIQWTFILLLVDFRWVFFFTLDETLLPIRPKQSVDKCQVTLEKGKNLLSRKTSYVPDAWLLRSRRSYFQKSRNDKKPVMTNR